jgi:hypothetical protein
MVEVMVQVLGKLACPVQVLCRMVEMSVRSVSTGLQTGKPQLGSS